MLLMKFSILFIFLFIFGKATQPLFSQNISSEKNELAFANYLINKAKYNDAIYILEQFSKKNSFATSITDSISFLKAWCYYNSKQADSAALYFGRVSNNSASFASARFFASFNNGFIKNYDLARNNLLDISTADSLYFALKNLDLAGLSLLERNLDDYQKFADNFSFSLYQLANEENEMNIAFKNISERKQKSMLIAGTLSAIVPGLGKIYTGKSGEGLAAFFFVGGLAAITIENYLKAGVNNYKTITFGTLFSIFYIGNIYGSVFSVKMQDDLFAEETNFAILFNMHLPLRTIFVP